MDGNITKSSATRKAKFSKPLQRRTLEGGKNCGILRVCERKVNELRGPLAVLVAQRGKSCGLSKWAAHSLIGSPIIVEPLNGWAAHFDSPCVASGWPICRGGCRGQVPFCNSVERDPEATNNVQANFRQLGNCEKTAIT